MFFLLRLSWSDLLLRKRFYVTKDRKGWLLFCFCARIFVFFPAVYLDCLSVGTLSVDFSGCHLATLLRYLRCAIVPWRCLRQGLPLTQMRSISALAFWKPLSVLQLTPSGTSLKQGNPLLFPLLLIVLSTKITNTKNKKFDFSSIFFYCSGGPGTAKSSSANFACCYALRQDLFALQRG